MKKHKPPYYYSLLCKCVCIPHINLATSVRQVIIHLTNFDKYLFILLIILSFISCKKEINKSNYSAENISGFTFKSTEFIYAGDELILDISPVIKYDVGAYFIITHPMGSSIEKAAGSGINLGNKYTKKRGTIWIQMMQGNNLIHEKKVRIFANKAVGNMASYIGPKSIITTTKEPCMVIGIPEDEFNNPMPPNTQVNYSLLRPNLNFKELDIRTDFLLSYHTFYASRHLGKSLVGIQCDSSFSEEKYVDEEAGWADDIKVIPIPKKMRADGKQYTTITTDIIRDKIGNKVMDGTIVTFRLKGNDNSINQYTSVTVDGKSKINFQHPVSTKNFEVTAISGNVKSKPIYLRFVSDVNNFDIKHNKQNNIINIGPITSYLNQFIPDGSEINYTIYDESKVYKKGFTITQKGIGIIEIEELFLGHQQYLLEIEYADINKKIIIYN